MRRLLLCFMLLSLCGAGPAAKTLLSGNRVSDAEIKGMAPALWLNGRDTPKLTVDADGSITGWADKSGNGYDFAQATLANRPYLTRADDLENRLIHSEDITQSGAGKWAVSNVTATSATVFTETAAAATTHYIEQVKELTNGAGYVFFSDLKKGTGRDWVYLRVNGTSAGGVWFNIGDGTKGTEQAGYTGTITALGDGIYRCAVAFTAAASESPGFQVYAAEADKDITFDGNATYTYNIYRAQVARTGKGYVTTTTFPQYAGLNGRAVPYFPGMTSYMTRAVTAGLDVTQGSASYFFVLRSDGAPDAGANKYVFQNETFNTSGMGYWLNTNGYSQLRTDQAGANTSVIGNTAFTAGTLGLYSFIKTGTSGQHYKNGAVDNAAGTSNNSVSATAAYLLGHSSSGMVGYLPELIVFPRALSLTEQAKLKRYMAQFYPIDWQ